MIFLILNNAVPLHIIITMLVGIILSITFHEFFHAITADKLGDSTPRNNGRVSLNPADHIDPIGFIAIMFLPIGWGKPVPINHFNFKSPRLGDAISTFMGPFANFLLIVFTIIIFKVLQIFGSAIPINVVADIAGTFISLNLGLMIFNLLPIPPLDGYHVLGFFLPHKIKDSIDNFFARQNFFVTLLLVYIAGQILLPVISVIFDLGSRVISIFL